MNVRAERESLDMTQKAFANVLGGPKRTVGRGRQGEIRHRPWLRI